MNRVIFRNWVRDLLQSDVRTELNADVYLTEFPWLQQYVPLGYAVENVKIKKVDKWVLGDTLSDVDLPGCDDLMDYTVPRASRSYLVDESGDLISMMHRGWWSPHTLYDAMNLIGDRAERIRFAVQVAPVARVRRKAWIRMFKFPKGESPMDFATRLINEDLQRQVKERKAQMAEAISMAE